MSSNAWRSSTLVALHEDPLGALDRAAALQCALELLDLLDELRLLGVALHDELDRALHLFVELRPGERVDPALGGAADEVRLVGAEQHDQRTRARTR